MRTLLISRPGLQPFVEDHVKQAAFQLTSVTGVSVGDGSLTALFIHVKTRTDAFEVRLSGDLKALTIDGVRPEALRFAVDFQRAYREPLRVFDSSYSFDQHVDAEVDATKLTAIALGV